MLQLAPRAAGCRAARKCTARPRLAPGHAAAAHKGDAQQQRSPPTLRSLIPPAVPMLPGCPRGRVERWVPAAPPQRGERQLRSPAARISWWKPVLSLTAVVTALDGFCGWDNCTHTLQRNGSGRWWQLTGQVAELSNLASSNTPPTSLMRMSTEQFRGNLEGITWAFPRKPQDEGKNE